MELSWYDACMQQDKRRRTPHFILVLIASVAMMIGASAPSPFYPVLQHQIGFSSLTLTTIFAVYAGALLVTLLIAGSLSDYIGRKPVMFAGFIILAISTFLFWRAHSADLLMTARIVQGIGTGILLSTLSAAIIDLEPKKRPGIGATLNSIVPLVGLSIGALAGGFALQYASAPESSVFLILTALYGSIAIAVWYLPETSLREQGALKSLIPKIGIPKTVRKEFFKGAPALFASWSTNGLYLSLGAPITAAVFGRTNHVEQALVVALLSGFGAIASFIIRKQSARYITLYGTSALAAGLVVTLLAITIHSYPLFVFATAIAGTGFGTSFLGVLRSITPKTDARERGRLFASIFVISYIGLGAPAVAAGLLVPHIGLTTTAYAYGIFVIALSSAAVLLRKFFSKD